LILRALRARKIKGFRKMAAVLILEASPKPARQRRAGFGLQSGEFAPEGRELSALKRILRIAGKMVKVLTGL